MQGRVQKYQTQSLSPLPGDGTVLPAVFRVCNTHQACTQCPLLLCMVELDKSPEGIGVQDLWCHTFTTLLKSEAEATTQTLRTEVSPLSGTGKTV